MLHCFCWNQGCWLQGLSQAVVWALLGSGSCLHVLSQALLSSSFDFRGKWCTIMAANICFTKIRLWSKFSPWCTVVKGGLSCSSSAQADEHTNETHSPSPGCCWSQWRCRAIGILDLVQLGRIATSLRGRWPCATAGLWHCRAAEPLVQTLPHVFTHVLLVPGSVKINKNLTTTSSGTPQQSPHSSCKSEVFTVFSESPTQFPYALIYTSLKASFWPQLNNLSQKDCKLSEKVLVIIIFLHLYSITSVLKAFSYSASGDKKLKCLCSQVH